MMIKEGSTKIINFMTPGASIHWGVNMHYLVLYQYTAHLLVLYKGTCIIMLLSYAIVDFYLFYDGTS